MSHIGFL